MAKVVIETELNTKSFDRQIQKLKTDIERYMRVLESDAKVPIKFQMSASERQEIETTIEKLRNQLIGLEQQAKKTGEVGEVAGEQSGRGFEKGITSLKRFALSLFGIRSAFSLVRRATSTYLSQHEDTANKINAIWVALGNALAPIIEAIANMVLKFIGYLNVFLQALGFDVDLTKGMNKSTKAINGTTKAMKELNNQVASFDEMNVVQKETSSGGTGGGGGIGGTNGFEMPELNENIVKFLQDTAKWLKENKELLFAIGGIIAGFKVAKWLSGLSSLIGGGTGASAKGLLGLSSILKGLLAMELIAITISLIYYGMKLNDLKNYNKELSKFYENNTKGLKEVNKENLETAKSYEKGSEEIDKYVYEMKQEIEQSKLQIDVKKRENSEMSALDKVWDAFGGTGKRNTEIIKENTQRLINNAENLQQLAKEGKLTDEQMKIYRETMQYLNETHDELGQDLKDNKMNMNQFGEGILGVKKDLYDQIGALQQADRESKISTKNQQQYINDLTNTTQQKFGLLNKLVAKPKLEVQANLSQMKQTIEKLSKTPVIGNAFLPVLTKMNAMGLKSGGIVYNPGRGVPLSNVFVGEATGGAEGVIPMNNEQSMDLIGQSIARHLVVNLTNTTMLDSKVIAREQRRIEDENNFATNGRGVL